MDFNLYSVKKIGKGNGNPLQYSCLENSMDRGAWWATVHGVTVRHNQVTNTYFRENRLTIIAISDIVKIPIKYAYTKVFQSSI